MICETEKYTSILPYVHYISCKRLTVICKLTSKIILKMNNNLQVCNEYSYFIEILYSKIDNINSMSYGKELVNLKNHD